MLYKVILNIGGAEPRQVASGEWDTPAMAFAELRGMTYGRIPVRTAWSVSLISKSRI